MASSVNDIVEKLTEYVQIKTEQLKLKIIGVTSRILGNIITIFLVAAIGLLFIFFLSLSIGALLNEVFESMYLGYLTITGFYFLLILVILILSKSGKIQSIFENLILKISEQEDESEN